MLQVKNDGINGPDQWSANFLCKKCLMLLLSFAVGRDNGHKQCRVDERGCVPVRLHLQKQVAQLADLCSGLEGR